MQDCFADFSPLVPESWFINAFSENNVQCTLRLVSNIPRNNRVSCVTEQTLFQYTPEAWLMRCYWSVGLEKVLAPLNSNINAIEPICLEWTNKIANHWSIQWLKKGLVPSAPGSLPQVIPMGKEGLPNTLTDHVRWSAVITITNTKTSMSCDVSVEWICPIGDSPSMDKTRSPGWSLDTGSLLDMLPMGTVLIDGDGSVIKINTWLKRQEPKLQDAVLPKQWQSLFDASWLQQAWTELREYQRAIYSTPVLHPYARQSGLANGPYTLSLTPAGEGAILQLTPLMERPASFEQTSRDHLTGLSTRAGWLEIVGEMLQSGRRKTYWVGIVGLDGFQTLNDTLGHDAGDWLLREVTIRLLETYPDAILGRWAGDEFVIISSGKLPESPFDTIFEKPFTYNAHVFNARCSAGIIEIPTDRMDTASQWVQYAEWALREAKGHGGNSTLRAGNSLSPDRKNLFYIENGFSAAVQNRQFFLLYQPLVDLRTKLIVGAEALIRWRHPEIGMIQPTNFIPVAEQTGAIIPLTAWVLETACREVKPWVGRSIDFFLSVNLSPSQFYDPNLVKNIEDLLHSLGFAPHNLKLEITEGVALHDTEHNREVLNSLKNLGVGLAIDDFGTGYSSLSYLKDFPVHQLKIDRSFVQGIQRHHNYTLTKNIITLAHNMGLLVVAEGVETEEQEEVLAAMDCDIVQGYRYGRPMEPAQLYQMLQAQKKHPLF